MSVMLQSLNNIRTLRAMAREFSIDVLEEMLEKFRVVTKERREEEEQQQRELAERREKISTGWSWWKLTELTRKSYWVIALLLHHALVKRQPRPAKYKFTDVNGETKTGPVRAVHRSQLLRRWQKVNLSTISWSNYWGRMSLLGRVRRRFSSSLVPRHLI